MDLNKYFSQTRFLVDHYVSINDYERAFYSLINALSKTEISYIEDFTNYFNGKRGGDEFKSNLQNTDVIIQEKLLFDNSSDSNVNSPIYAGMSKTEKQKFKDKNKKKRNKANKAARLKESTLEKPLIAEAKSNNVKNIIEAIESKISLN